MTTPSDPGREGQQEPDESTVAEARVTSARPRSVTFAFALWTGVGVLLAIFAVPLVFRSADVLADAAREILAQQGKQQPSAQEVDDTARNIRISGMVTFGIGILELLFAFFMYTGRSWARIALCVVGGLGAVLMVLSLSLVTLILLILTGAAIFLMFRPDANEFFAASRRLIR
jgi:uncharacterized membrane protein